MSIELVEYKDCVQPFLIHHSSIRGKVVRLADVADTILTRHAYPDVVSHLLAEMLVIATMLSANLKSKGILTVQLKGDGLVKFIVADATATGKMRGYADLAEGAAEKLSALKPEKTKLSDIVGKGYVAITLDQGKEPYQGIVELNGESLTETVQDYFTQSEQSGVMLKIIVGKTREEEWRAGGILLQHMPEEGGNVPLSVEAKERKENDTPEEQWMRACVLAETVKDTELLDQYLPPQQLLYRLFNEDGVWVYGAKEVEEKCRCSREKISRTLASFPQAEIEEYIVEGAVSINCQFCNSSELFNAEELAALFKN